MKLPGYYSSGEFARMAQVSIRTIRFYDKQNILKPSFVNENGARFYTDSDFAHLQQILLLKYLGFSLDDIREITINEVNQHFLMNSLNLQKKLVQDRIEQMQLVENAIENIVDALGTEKQIDWSQMLDLIHLTGMEKSLKSQYQNANNISARIRLHKDYSVNPEGWFPWILAQCETLWNKRDDFHILEIGCGNGTLWTENFHHLPSHIHVTLSDISEGMVRESRRNIGAQDTRFRFATFDCHNIPYPSESYDLIIANHVLFYCDDIAKVCKEIQRCLKQDGVFLCSTYSEQHMKKITELVQEFDSRIVLSGQKLYERFGLANGESILQEFFADISCRKYNDAIQISDAEPLIAYILSCHGNQNQYLLDRYRDFRAFVEKKVGTTYYIPKDTGIFFCRK